MKRLFLIIPCLLCACMVFSQAKKPTLMVMPADNWCFTNSFMNDFDNGGSTIRIPDYTAALQQNTDLNLAISTINSLMAERGFPLKDLEQTLRNINQQAAEDMLITSKNGNELAETPVDRLLRTAKADIVLYLNWNVKTNGPKKILTYILEAKDAYTGKSIASVQGASEPSFSADVTILLQEAVLANIDNFNSNLQQYFEDMFDNGREVALEIRIFADNEAGIDLETEYGEDATELIEIIDDWLAENTVQGRFSKLGSSEYYASYEQVRIPLYKNNGTALDTEAWVRQLRNVLRKEPYNIPVKVMNRGLGKTILVLGEK